MNIEWLKNKAKEKFYPITHAKAVLFGENNRTVNDEIELLKNDLSNVKVGTTPVAKAVADEDGNNIKSTYVKKTEVPSGSIVDSELSETSVNPVQNKVVTAELNNLRQMISGAMEIVRVNYYVTFTSAATGAAGYVDKYYNNLLAGEKTPFNYDTGNEGVPICGGMLQWYYPSSSPMVGDLKANIGCYVNGNKVEAGGFLFQAVNYTSLINYKYSVSVVPWTKPETT